MIAQFIAEVGARVVVDAKPSSSQQLALDEFIENAKKSAKQNGSSSSGCLPSLRVYTPPSNSMYEPSDVFDTKNFTVGELLLPVGRMKTPKEECEASDGVDCGYALGDGNNISELLRVATDMDLAFTYNSRRIGEFCFESNSKNMRGRLVVFADLGTKIAVRERYNGNDLRFLRFFLHNTEYCNSLLFLAVES
ncbi:unnamed protein product [Gongylonema pulchrum]|uniref:Uncharacterized protein n=1 Tax=Gongylonema pulchrum TaxID=637853 RepID=A0A3P7NSQ3_9BILA|nr:unnamed protein product [Gongylonema pulchrum]